MISTDACPRLRPQTRLSIFDELRRRARRVAIGNFDGVHLGHRQVIGDHDTILTFDPHPLTVVGQVPALLSDMPMKVSRLSDLGVTEIVVIPFDHRIASLAPQAFIDETLVRRLGAVTVAVGENFRFGAGGAGGVATLAADQRFETRAVPLLAVKGEVVSSTRIRRLVQAGSVALAGDLLGSPFELPVSVVDETPSRDPHIRMFLLSVSAQLVRPAVGTYAATIDGLPGVVAVSDSQFQLLIDRSLLDPGAEALSGRLQVRFLDRIVARASRNGVREPSSRAGH